VFTVVAIHINFYAALLFVKVFPYFTYTRRSGNITYGGLNYDILNWLAQYTKIQWVVQQFDIWLIAILKRLLCLTCYNTQHPTWTCSLNSYIRLSFVDIGPHQLENGVIPLTNLLIKKVVLHYQHFFFILCHYLHLIRYLNSFTFIISRGKVVEFVPMLFPPKLLELDQQVDFTYPVAIQYYRFMMPYPEKEESSYRFSAILRPFNSKVMPTALILFSDSTRLNLMFFF